MYMLAASEAIIQRLQSFISELHRLSRHIAWVQEQSVDLLMAHIDSQLQIAAEETLENLRTVSEDCIADIVKYGHCCHQRVSRAESAG